ncbi:MAG: hypothetical protein ACRDMX_10550 [Solirubrobacteraceae bacterium]
MSDRAPDALLIRLAQLPAAVPLLARLGQADGVYLVGGAVRDLLLGLAPSDLDLVVDGELARAVELLGALPVAQHDRFGTCTVALDGRRYDIARARSERYERPGALPTVLGPATIEQDLRRRDFTVNALAIGLGGTDRGRLLQAPGGLADLDRAQLRVLHDDSFLEDPTRLARLARYSARLHFSTEPHTRRLAVQALAAGAPATVSGARLGAELRMLASEPDPIAALRRATEIGIADAFAPGLALADEQPARQALELLPADGDRRDLVLAVAAMGVPSAELRGRLEGLAFEAGARERIAAAAVGAERLAHALRAARRPSEIAAAVGSAPVEQVALAGALGPNQAAREWLLRLRGARLAIDGDDLLAAGVPQGPAVGAALAAARAAMLDGRAPCRERQLAEALRAAG